MPRWIVAQEGSRQTYAVPLAFHRLGLLRLCYVDIWCRGGRSVLRRGPKGARALATRFNQELPPEKVISFNPRAVLYRSLFHFRKPKLSPERLGADYVRFGQWFATRVRDHLSRQELSSEQDLFFGFSTNCLEAMELLRKRQVLTVLDQVDPGKVEEDIVVEEAERWPGWEPIPGRMPAEFWERVRAEWEMADVVLVNSDWSAKALVQQRVREDKIIVVPLALDLPHNHSAEPVLPHGPLRVLWLGSVILRKGIQYLVEAARLLQNQQIEFLLAGPLGISAKAVQCFPPNIKILGRITRDQLGKVYKQAHVFVLPTLSDGFAVTQLEAMAHGLPVIATPNCGRVVTDGVDGLIVPARDGQALANAVVRLAADRTLLREMSERALKTVTFYDLPSNARLIHREIMQRKVSATGGDSRPTPSEIGARPTISQPCP